jgi:hypothetical protein
MENPVNEPTNVPVPAPANEQQKVRLVDVEIVDEGMALNVMVSFLNLAQKRGVFSMDESAKIWECVKKFQRNDR